MAKLVKSGAVDVKSTTAAATLNIASRWTEELHPAIQQQLLLAQVP